MLWLRKVFGFLLYVIDFENIGLFPKKKKNARYNKKAIFSLSLIMKFKQFFDSKTVEALNRKYKSRILTFCAASFLFAIFCAVVIVLNISNILNLKVCVCINSCLSIAYIWYAVLFFKAPPESFYLYKFSKKLVDADKNYLSLKYVGDDEKVKIDGISYTRLNFDDAKLLLPTAFLNPLKSNMLYTLEAVGNVLTGYRAKEAVYDVG